MLSKKVIVSESERAARVVSKLLWEERRVEIYMVLRAECDSVTETAVHLEVHHRLTLFENIDCSN